MGRGSSGTDEDGLGSVPSEVGPERGDDGCARLLRLLDFTGLGCGRVFGSDMEVSPPALLLGLGGALDFLGRALVLDGGRRLKSSSELSSSISGCSGKGLVFRDRILARSAMFELPNSTYVESVEDVTVFSRGDVMPDEALVSAAFFL